MTQTDGFLIIATLFLVSAAIEAVNASGDAVPGFQFAQPVTLTMFYDVTDLQSREQGLATVPYT